MNRYHSDMRKCAIIGCGYVGATTAYTLMLSRIFSEIVLIDINTKKADGEAADLNHSLPFIGPMNIFSGNYSDLADAAIIIITAGAGQRPGQSRTDLAILNVEVFKSIINNIVRYNTNAILLIVTNPVDVLTHVTLRLSGFPKERVIGSGTVLDTARLKYLAGQYLGIDSRNIHSFIIGEHGDSELAVWSCTNVSGIPLDKFCRSNYLDCGMDRLHGIYDSVRSSAYGIIDTKGATYYAIAESVRRIVYAIVNDEDSVLPVTSLIQGQYGLEDVCLSLPCIVGRGGIKKIVELPLNNDELSDLRASAEKIKHVIHSYFISPATI